MDYLSTNTGREAFRGIHIVFVTSLILIYIPPCIVNDDAVGLFQNMAYMSQVYLPLARGRQSEQKIDVAPN